MNFNRTHNQAHMALNARRYDAMVQARPEPEYIGLTIGGVKLDRVEFTALGLKLNYGTQCAASYLKDIHGWPLGRTRQLLCVVGRNIHPIPHTH